MNIGSAGFFVNFIQSHPTKISYFKGNFQRNIEVAEFPAMESYPMKLTDLECKNAKPREKDYKMFDGAGLYLEVRTTSGPGRRNAFFRYGGSRVLPNFAKEPTLTP